ncbi:MAG: adenosine deaminase [Streptococcaceae bacterium]|jgi:adenosine deaminase|nr:adenosine deaminase [Streptococcaceae bacterium]
MKATASQIAQLPKVELHCHLDGSLSIACIQQLANNMGVRLGTDEEVRRKAQAPEKTPNLLTYLKCFDFVVPLLQTAQNLKLAAYDVCKQAAEDKVKYFEVRFAPAQHLTLELTLETAVEAVIEGLIRAEAEFDVTANLLVCGLRQFPQEELALLPDLFTTIAEDHLVGFDLAGDEMNYPQKNFYTLLNKVRDKGVGITLHAGECPHCEANIVDSVEMGATRIGHGVMAKDIPAYWETLIAKKIVLEMAPTSNFQTNAIEKLSDYPFKRLYDAGVHVTLNTDNRTVSNTTLQQEYEKIAGWYDFSVADFAKINDYAIEGAFVPESFKEVLKENFARDFAEI